MHQEHPIKISERMGAIACNDTILAIEFIHGAGDGDYSLRFVDIFVILRNTGKCRHVPRSVELEFKPQIQSQPKITVFCAADGNLSRILSDQKDDQSKRHFDNYYFTIPFNEIRGYTESDEKIHRISENMWTSLVLDYAAFSKKTFSETAFSISTVYNLRRLVPKEEINDLSRQNYIASLPVTGHPSIDSSIRELGEMMRSDFKKGLDSGFL